MPTQIECSSLAATEHSLINVSVSGFCLLMAPNGYGLSECQDAIYGEGNDDDVKAKPAAASKKRKTAEEEEDVKQQAAVIDFKVQPHCTKDRVLPACLPACKHVLPMSACLHNKLVMPHSTVWVFCRLPAVLSCAQRLQAVLNPSPLPSTTPPPPPPLPSPRLLKLENGVFL